MDHPAWLLEQLHGQDGPCLAALPPGNAALPDLLALAGCRQLTVPGAASGIWIGRGGATVWLNQDHPLAQTGAGQEPLRGELPSAATPAEDLERLHALQRNAAARALALAGRPTARAASAAAPADAPWGAFNPLPVARRALCTLATQPGPCPLAVADDLGARHPVQRLREAQGLERWLTVLPLGALAATRLRPLHVAAAGGHWEVSPKVLDNGRVRAEFDAQGRLERLSWDGSFAAWRGPALTLHDAAGRELRATAVRVLEAGPVRAVLAIDYGATVLHCQLTDQDDALGVLVASLEAPCQLALPLDGTAPVVCGDALGARVAPGATQEHGVRWALAGDGLGTSGILSAPGRALALSCTPGATLRPQGAGLAVALTTGLCLRLASGAQLPPGVGLPLREHAPWDGEGLPARWRLLSPPQVAVLWVMGAAGPGAAQGQLLVAELLGSRSRCFLYPRPRPAPLGAAAKVDLDGVVREALRPTAEQDGWQIMLKAHELALLRWTL